MSDEVLPCAWCGKEPDAKLKAPDGMTPLFFYCHTTDCPNEFAGVIFDGDWDGWNENQRRILEQRRKDFDAGRFSVVSPARFFGLYYRDFDEYLKAK